MHIEKFGQGINSRALWVKHTFVVTNNYRCFIGVSDTSTHLRKYPQSSYAHKHAKQTHTRFINGFGTFVQALSTVILHTYAVEPLG